MVFSVPIVRVSRNFPVKESIGIAWVWFANKSHLPSWSSFVYQFQPVIYQEGHSIQTAAILYFDEYLTCCLGIYEIYYYYYIMCP